MEVKPTTVRETKTVVHVVTKTVAKVVEKPYIHPLTYVITAAAGEAPSAPTPWLTWAADCSAALLA